VEPLKLYERFRQRNYTFDEPLDQLVDAARPESLTARKFKLAVDALLAKTPGPDDGGYLQASLDRWKANHGVLEPILVKANLYNVANISRDLSSIAGFGLEALDFIRSGKQAPAEWQVKAAKALDRAQSFQAEVEIAVISPIRKLTLAAGQWDKLKGMSGDDRTQALDTQVQAAKRKSWE
jgi:hypothetical protein